MVVVCETETPKTEGRRMEGWSRAEKRRMEGRGMEVKREEKERRVEGWR